MNRNWLFLPAAGTLACGLWTMSAASADGLPDLPAFRQPIQLSPQIEHIPETPAAEHSAASGSRMLRPFSAFPKPRFLGTASPPPPQVLPEPKPVPISSVGHAGVQPQADPFPPASFDKWNSGPALTDALMPAPRPDSLVVQPTFPQSEIPSLVTERPIVQASSAARQPPQQSAAQRAAPRSAQPAAKPTLLQKLGLRK